MGGGDRQEVRRKVACRNYVSQSLEPVLAYANSLHLEEFRGGGAARKGHGYPPVGQPTARCSRHTPQRLAPEAADALVVRRFRWSLRERSARRRYGRGQDRPPLCDAGPLW